MKPKLTKSLKSLEKTLFFLTILFLPTQLGKHFWPDFSSVYSLRIDYLSPTIYFWDLLVAWLVLSHLIRLFLKHAPLKINKMAGIIFLFFFITQLTSVSFALNPAASFVKLEQYFAAGLFGLYLASVDFVVIRKPFFAGLLSAVIFSCLLGIAQFLAGSSLGIWVLGEREFSVSTPLTAKFIFYDRIFLRPYATFPHPNMFAGFLLAVLPLLLVGLSNSLRGFKTILSLLVLSTVFITFSRPALVLVNVYLLTMFRRFWKLLAIAAVAVTPLIVVRFVSIFTFDTLAVLRREELSAFAVKIFLIHPYFGIGLNNFISNLALSEVLVGTSRFLQPVHNIFLLSLSETGITGFVGFMTLLGTALILNLKAKTLFNKALCTSLFIIIFLSFFDHYFLTLPQGQRLLFMIIGLSFNADKS